MGTTRNTLRPEAFKNQDPIYSELFDHLYIKYGIVLLNEELKEIADIVNNINTESDADN